MAKRKHPTNKAEYDHVADRSTERVEDNSDSERANGFFDDLSTVFPVLAMRRASLILCILSVAVYRTDLVALHLLPDFLSHRFHVLVSFLSDFVIGHVGRLIGRLSGHLYDAR